MVDLEKELEKFRGVVKDNPDFFRNLNLDRRKERKAKNEIGELLEEFLYMALDKYEVNGGTYDLIGGCLIDSKFCRCFKVRADESVKIYNPIQVYRRLSRFNDPGSRFLLSIEERTLTGLEKLGLKRGFNIDAKNFITDVYKIIYETYLKNAEKKSIAH